MSISSTQIECHPTYVKGLVVSHRANGEGQHLYIALL
jgi:hypothetical protein